MQLKQVTTQLHEASSAHKDLTGKYPNRLRCNADTWYLILRELHVNDWEDRNINGMSVELDDAIAYMNIYIDRKEGK